MVTKTKKRNNAQINVEDLVSEPAVRIHPETMKNHGFQNGDQAQVVNQTGAVQVPHSIVFLAKNPNP
ncbi:MAG: hypothetical protein GY786_25110 [Proteobacteria bacterium]|nr:hypothetical protein [Pseudomonadota bacterium]